jgi:hypothetical protein
MPRATATPGQSAVSTPLAVPTDLAFSMPLVEVLSRSGLRILSVQSSTFMSMFSTTDKAAWIQTDRGILDAVFFASPAEAARIHISLSKGEEGRFLYTLEAPPPTLAQDVTIDAAFPLYFTVESGILMVTSSAELDQALKRIFPAR